MKLLARLLLLGLVVAPAWGGDDAPSREQLERLARQLTRWPDRFTPAYVPRDVDLKIKVYRPPSVGYQMPVLGPASRQDTKELIKRYLEHLEAAEPEEPDAESPSDDEPEKPEE